MAVALAVGLNTEKCDQRRRIAALRDGINSMPVRFLSADTVYAQTLVAERGLAEGDNPPHYSRGTLPKSPQDAIARINDMRGSDTEPLTLNDVYIHAFEAVNDNLIEKYWMFLGASTLRNCAVCMEEGVAFMNSHRTGTLSTPSELPFGRTFAGRYEQYRDADGKVHHRALGWLFMLKGIKPNGESGPSTDDYHAMIEAQTLFDVSAGLPPDGWELCDLCGVELNTNGCQHIPGTTYKMTKEQIDAQLARGVPRGYHTFTLMDNTMSEVSGVFAGAVPGAGFRRAMSAARHRDLSSEELRQVRSSYGHLLRKGEFEMSMSVNELTEAVEGATENGFVKAWKKLFGAGAPPPAQWNDEGQPATQAQASAPDPRVEELQRQLAERDEKLALVAQETRLAAAASFADTFITQGRLLPSGRAAAIALHAQMEADDLLAPVTLQFTNGAGDVVEGGRAKILGEFLAALPPHKLTKEIKASELPKGAIVLGAQTKPNAKEELDAEVEALLMKTPEGRAALAARIKQNA